MQPNETKFRPDIEGLRAIAVLMVIAFHAEPDRLSGGFIGVDVFFVLSGYLISGLLMREVEESGGLSLVRFYARRVRRLLPASLLMLVATIVATRILLPPTDQLPIAASARATFAYLSNLYFIRVSSDYFGGGSAGNPLLHTWSLAVEEQFYVLWPVLILATSRMARGRSLRRSLAWTMGVIAVLSFAGSLWLTARRPPVAFFFVLPRAWEFAAGALASLWTEHATQLARRTRTGLGWIGLLTLCVAAFLITAPGFPGVKALFPVLGTGALLVAGVGDKAATGASKLLQAKPLLWIGARSYSLYLWHWPLLVFAAVLVTPFSTPVRLGCVVASFILADLTYRLVENPVRRNPFLLKHAGLCITASLIIMVFGIGAMLGWRSWSMRSENYRIYWPVIVDLPKDSAMGCENAFGDSVPHECDFGAREAAKTVVMFGDSHMEQWLPTLEAIADRQRWKIVLFVKSACPAVAIPVWDPQSGQEDLACSAWRKAAVQRIVTLKPSLVLLTNFSGYLHQNEADRLVSPSTWSNGARSTFAELAKAGVPTVFLHDTPWARFEVTQCLSRDQWRGTQRCAPLKRSAALNEEIYGAIVEGARSVEGANGRAVSFVDLSNEICGPELCDLTKGTMIVYRDSGHLTGTYLRSLAPALDRALLAAVPALGTK